MGKLKSYQEQLQEIVSKGINAAEEQQRKLAAKPFELAEKLESDVREYSVEGLRNCYNGYSENLFEQLRNLNGRFGNFAAELVARIEKDVSEGADAVVETAFTVAEKIEEDVVEVAFTVAETAEEVKESVSEEKPVAKKTTAKKAPAAKKESTPA